MSLGVMPVQLSILGKPTVMEVMILTLIHPVIRIYKVRGYGQYKGGKVHVINFPQDLTEVFHIIPQLLEEIPMFYLQATIMSLVKAGKRKWARTHDMKQIMSKLGSAMTKIYFGWVKSHIGIEGNKRVDVLVKAGVQKRGVHILTEGGIK
ncbi:hypothetical protein EV426DRAFT_712069 [Tirmania nivea]|nr:hypothetical protein EV426DRAFT_712069 [Tirmania nivea]